MATSRIEKITPDTVKPVRPGDPEGDFDYVPIPDVGGFAINQVRKAERQKRRRAQRIEAFISGDYGFVPDSLGAITLAVDDINLQIDAKYDNSPEEERERVVGRFFAGIIHRKTYTAKELGNLAHANSPIDSKHYDPTTFSFDNLIEKQDAMEAVALHQLRANALATETWTQLDSKHRPAAIEDELRYMATLGSEQIEMRWRAAWESTNNELIFWTAKIKEAEQNVHVIDYLVYHPELREQP